MTQRRSNRARNSSLGCCVSASSLAQSARRARIGNAAPVRARRLLLLLLLLLLVFLLPLPSPSLPPCRLQSRLTSTRTSLDTRRGRRRAATASSWRGRHTGPRMAKGPPEGTRAAEAQRVEWETMEAGEG